MLPLSANNRQALLLFILIEVLSTLTLEGSGIMPATNTLNANAVLAKKIAARKLGGYFTPSLSAKNTLDFLLWPAISIQERLCSINGSEIECPTHNIECGVQCDAVISISSSGSMETSSVFARYYVTPFDYHIGVVWGEPHGRGFNFPVYAPTLSIASDSLAFRVHHDLFPDYVQTFAKPFGRQAFITNMFGDYPLLNIHFAESESEGLCLATSKTQLPASVALCGTTATSYGDSARSVRLHSASINRDRYEVTLSNTVIRTIVFEYRNETPVRKLQKKEIVFHPEPVAVRLADEGAKIRINQQTFTVNDFSLLRNTTGRRMELQYETMPRLRVDASFPSSIVEYEGRNNQIVRKATLTDFRPTSTHGNETECHLTEYCSFTPDDFSYRELIKRNWKRESISEADRDTICVIRERILKASKQEDLSVGILLKELNKGMELSRLLKDSPSLIQFYRKYLETLAKFDLDDTILTGGYSAIDTLVLWQRFSDADALMPIWLEAVLQNCRPAEAARFLETQMSLGSYWGSVRLASALMSEAGCETVTMVETLGAIALLKARNLLHRKNESLDEISSSQILWIQYSIGASEFAERSTRAAVLIKELLGENRLTSRYRALLNGIDLP